MATTILRNKSTQYIDLDFSFARHPVTETVSVKKDKNAVKQSVLHLMFLKSGDKPFHPEIKSPLYDFLFETASPIIQTIIEGEVYRYINRYEPRIELTLVKITFPDVNTMSCEMEGVLVNTTEEITIKVLIDRLR